MYYNEEKLRSERPSKFFIALGLAVSSILYRVFIASVLFAIAPFWSIGIAFLLYLVNITINKSTGE